MSIGSPRACASTALALMNSAAPCESRFSSRAQNCTAWAKTGMSPDEAGIPNSCWSQTPAANSPLAPSDGRCSARALLSPLAEAEDEDEGVGFCLAPRLGGRLSCWLSKTGFPPFFPASALIFLRYSSRTIRRFMIAPVSGSIDATPFSRILVRVVVRVCLSKFRSKAISSSVIERPARISNPRFSDSCMRHSMSNQTDRSCRDRDCTPRSFLQSPG
jgi:hypothetical protein